MIQWLGLHASTSEGPGSIPGHGTKIPQDVLHTPYTSALTDIRVCLALYTCLYEMIKTGDKIAIPVFKLGTLMFARGL